MSLPRDLLANWQPPEERWDTREPDPWLTDLGDWDPATWAAPRRVLVTQEPVPGREVLPWWLTLVGAFLVGLCVGWAWFGGPR
jgi:hypothetical protein